MVHVKRQRPKKAQNPQVILLFRYNLSCTRWIRLFSDPVNNKEGRDKKPCFCHLFVRRDLTYWFYMHHRGFKSPRPDHDFWNLAFVCCEGFSVRSEDVTFCDMQFWVGFSREAVSPFKRLTAFFLCSWLRWAYLVVMLMVLCPRSAWKSFGLAPFIARWLAGASVPDITS